MSPEKSSKREVEINPRTEEKRVNGMIRMLKKFDILEMCRSGILAVSGVD